MRRSRLLVGCGQAARVRPSVRRCRGSLGKWARIGCFLGRLVVPVLGLSALPQLASAPLLTLFLFARVTRRCARAAGRGRRAARRRRSTGRTCLFWLRGVGVARRFQILWSESVLALTGHTCAARLLNSGRQQSYTNVCSPQVATVAKDPSGVSHDAPESRLSCLSRVLPREAKNRAITVAVSRVGLVH